MSSNTRISWGTGTDMKSTYGLVASSLVLALSTAPCISAGEYLLYAPGPSEGKKPSGPDEGVLVKSITIRKGDTLYSLSRKYSGKGPYYPQILLFNEIINPNLIYAGNKILVPVKGEEKEAGATKPENKSEAVKEHKRSRKRGKSAAVTTTARPVEEKRQVSEKPTVLPKVGTETKITSSPKPAVEARVQSVRKSEEGEQALYEKGISAYKTGAYQQSIDTFDSFLSKYPASPLVPDVTLYRADALLKLSAQ